MGLRVYLYNQLTRALNITLRLVHYIHTDRNVLRVAVKLSLYTLIYVYIYIIRFIRFSLTRYFPIGDDHLSMEQIGP